MSKKFERTGYDYIPVPGEVYYPGGNPAGGADAGEVVASGTDSDLVRDASGNLIITDKKGNRRSR